MSLINNMLNELEKNKQDDKANGQARQEALSGIKPTIRKQNAAFNSSSSKKAIYWVLMAIVLTVAIAIAVKHFLPKTTAGVATSSTSTLKAKAADIAKNLKSKKTVTSAALPKVKLQDITLSQKDDQTILTFILSAPIQYLVEHTSEQKLSITLNATGISGNIPVKLDDSFISTLNTKQNKNNTVIMLSLLPGTKIDDLQLLDKPKSQLRVVFSNSQLSNSSMIKVPTPVSLEQQAEQRYQEILELLAQNKIHEATTSLRLFVGDFPDNLQAREILASLLIKEGRLQKADEILTIGLNKYNYYIPFVKLKAHVLAKLNKTDEAIELLQNHEANIDPNDIESLALLAALYQQQGSFIQAAGLYDKLAKMQPQRTIWWVGLGTSLESAGQKNAAKEAFQLAYKNSDVPPSLAVFLNDKISR